MNKIKSISIETGKYIQFVNITTEVQQYLQESGIKDGIAIVYTPHTTAGITINENADPSVPLDMENFLKKKIPHESFFKHLEGNSPSHIMSSLFSASETLIINEGKLLLGTWQCIYFCEFDGPRRRRVIIKLLSD